MGANRSVDINRLLEIVKDNRILQRGIRYFYDGRITKYLNHGDFITASVKGSMVEPYKLEIELDETGRPTYYGCNCPYSKGRYMCKHIVAVLALYMQEEEFSVPKENPIIRDREKFSKDTEIRLAGTSHRNYKTLDHIENLRGITTKGDRKSGKKFTLIFVIENDYGNTPYYRREKMYGDWCIYPALRYVRKNGELGRFVKFKEKNLTEPCSEEEAALLQKLIEFPYQNGGFIDYADYLIRNKFKNVYLKTDYKDYYPVFFEEIEKMVVNFGLKGKDDNSIFFASFLDIYGKRGGKLEKFDPLEPYKAERRGFDIYIISHDGRIFFIQHSRSFYSLFKIISKFVEGFTYHDIRKMKEYFQDISQIDISFDVESIRFVKPIPKTIIELDPSYSNAIGMELLFEYSGRKVPYKSDYELFLLSEEAGEIKMAQRNREYENKIYRYLYYKFDFIEREVFQNKLFVKKPLIDFLSQNCCELIEENIEVRLKGRKNKISSSGGSLSINVSSGIDWFDLDMGYVYEDGYREKVVLDWQLLEKGLIKTGDSYTIISKEYIDKLKALEQEKELKDGKIRISKYNFGIIDELYENIENRKEEDIKNIREISDRLRDFKRIKAISLPKKFNGTLRHYQKAGLNWLWFLNRYKLNGCLADDMGLGKTVQALTLIQKLKEEKCKKKNFKTSLIVVPVSAISNWEIELKKFTPDIKYIIHLGQKRKKCIEHLTKFDIVLVSYHTLRNDIKLFNETDYGYIILDESQNIKNYKSLTFKAIKTLESNYRLSLTGTPVENNTLELWSQMEFLNPGLLGTLTEFKRKFARPIEQLKDEGTAEKLKKKVFPFILRRKKEDVIKELPAKSEIVLYSEMDKKQRNLYENYRLYYRKKVMGKIKESGIGNSAFDIFTALLKLRQVALFPSLADRKHKNIPSCKFEQAKELINESLQEGHKILIFSQFVKSLKIIRQYMDKHDYKYSYLDGSVSAKKRKEQIKNFQSNDNIRLFLLSLKAGGTAINLTAADYVILFDPWWNPAVETQAVDRAHRIGQNQRVIAYKMIVKNTVEEKILELQEKKKELVENIITADSSFYKSLTKKDIVNLFS
jgi:SNF2 family DNA or RNA helicase